MYLVSWELLLPCLFVLVVLTLNLQGHLSLDFQSPGEPAAQAFFWIYSHVFKRTCVKCDNVMYDGSSKRAKMRYLPQNHSSSWASAWCGLTTAFLNVWGIGWCTCIFVDKHEIFRVVSMCHWLTIIFKFKLVGIRYLFSPCSYIIIIISIIFIRFIFMPYHCEKLSLQVCFL